MITMDQDDEPKIINPKISDNMLGRILFVAAAVFVAAAISVPGAPRVVSGASRVNAVVPYLTDIVGEPNVAISAVRGRTENGDLHLIGTFKLFNPDTVPFYLWVSFENGAKLTHARSRGRAEYPTVRLVNLELRYKNAISRPIVKPFPDDFGPPLRRTFGGGTSSTSVDGSSSGRFGKKKTREKPSAIETELGVSHRIGAKEIAFWKEDVQGYYEMELWGVLYAPDVKAAVYAGNYVENIHFNIETASRCRR